MNKLDISGARRTIRYVENLANTSILLLKCLLFAALLGVTMYACAANASPAIGRQDYVHMPRHQHVVIHNQAHKSHAADAMPYVFIGAIAGIVIYRVVRHRCEYGHVCVRF